jgi:hypothetical protein
VVCDVIHLSPDPALRQLLEGVLLKAGMQGAEIIRMVEKRSSSEGLDLLSCHLNGEYSECKERASRVSHAVLNTSVTKGLISSLLQYNLVL